MSTSTSESSVNPVKKIKFGIRSKFLFILLGSVIACVMITAYQGLIQTQTALNESIFQHLVSLRSSRKEQIERYFESKRAEMRVFSGNPAVVQAMREFKAAVKLLEVYDTKPEEEELDRLRDHYRRELLEKIQSKTGEVKVVDSYLPQSDIARYLQSHYIVNNPAPVGNKHLHRKALDGSYYSELHDKHHPVLHQIAENFGFYDVFLINNDDSRILYSVFKELDFGTSLHSGPHFESNLADGVRQSMLSPTRNKVTVIDYKAYAPSLNTAAAFFVVPIYDGVDLIGTLAAQISTDQVNKIMTDGNHWKRDGLGDTGEAFLVGSDKLMRSDSRFILEARQEVERRKTTEYKQQQAAAKKAGEAPRETRNLALDTESTILRQRVDNEGIVAALRGTSGIQEVQGYRREKIMSAYAPLDIPGVDWVIVAEKGYKEANQPITTIEKSLLTGASITTALMTLYGLLVSNLLFNPIQRLLKNVNKILRGENAEVLTSKRRDEFGQLINAVNDVTVNLKRKEEVIQQQKVQLKERLLMMYPSSIADKIDAGEKLVGSAYQNVAIVVVTLQGFNEAVVGVEADESVALLNQVINAFDESAELNNVEKITSQGNLYIATSGLLHPRLDYARSAVAFAESLFVIIERFNITTGDSIAIRVGISSGDVTAGIVGLNKPVYNLMGDVVTVANVLTQCTSTNSVRVSAPVFNQMLEKDSYAQCDIISLPHVGEVANWEKVFPTDRAEKSEGV